MSAHQPQIAVSPEVIVGKTVDLTCSYPVELNKTTTFKWYVNDTRSSATTQQHILQFNVTKTDKYNVYKCEVEVTTAGSNERPLFDKTIKLQPKCKKFSDSFRLLTKQTKSNRRISQNKLIELQPFFFIVNEAEPLL